MVTFDIDKSEKAIVVGDEVSMLRENFSVENKAARFGRFHGKFMPYRKYIITPTGRFDIGMYYEFRKYLKQKYKDIRIQKSTKFSEKIYPRLRETMKISPLG